MVEPDAAPNAAEDMTVAIARPPRSLPSQTYAARKHSLTMPAAPRALEIGDHIEHELQHEQHRAGSEQRARRIEREADRAHRRLPDLPAIGELAEAVPGEQHEEHEREEMGEQIGQRFAARAHEAVQDLDADVAALFLRERERAEDDQHHRALGDLEG